jgi:hypothetical protein
MADDVERYIQKRKEVDDRFAREFDSGYEKFMIGYLLKKERKKLVLLKKN